MEKPSIRTQRDWSHVANLPDNCSVQASGRHLYVVRRTYTYDKESRKTQEKRITLGQIVDNIFYTCEEYKLKFKRGMVKRSEQKIEDLICDNKFIEKLGKEQISYLSKTLTTGLVGAVPLLWHIVKKSGLYDDLMSAFKSHILVTKIVSIACYFIISNNNDSRYYSEFSKTHYLPYKGILSSQDISIFYKEITFNDHFKKIFFAERIKKLNKQDILLSIDSTTIASSASRYSLAPVGKGDNGNNKQIGLAIVFDSSTHEPICYRTLPGNSSDSRTLLEMLADLSHFGIEQKCVAVLDRDCCNIDNIGLAQDMGLRACMPLALQSAWSCQAVDKALPELDMHNNMLRGGEVSGVTVPTCVLDNSGINRKFWIHVYKSKNIELSITSAFFKEIEEFENIWISKRGKVKSLLEIDKIAYFTYDKNNTEMPLVRNMDEIKKQLVYAGCFATITTYECSAQDCFDICDLQSDIKRVLGSDMSDVNFDVLRTHGTRTYDGKTFISFIALIILEHAKQELAKERIKKMKRGKVVEIPANCYNMDDVLEMSKNIKYHRRPVSGEMFYLDPSEEQHKIAKAMGCENIYMNKIEY